MMHNIPQAIQDVSLLSVLEIKPESQGILFITLS